jgi:hypothetical protein
MENFTVHDKLLIGDRPHRFIGRRRSRLPARWGRGGVARLGGRGRRGVARLGGRQANLHLEAGTSLEKNREKD